MSPLTAHLQPAGDTGCRGPPSTSYQASHGKAQPGAPRLPAAHAGTCPSIRATLSPPVSRGQVALQRQGAWLSHSTVQRPNAHLPRRSQATCVGPAPACLPSALAALAKAREGCWGQWQDRTGEQGVQQGRQPPWGPPAAVTATCDAPSTLSWGLLIRPSGLPERTLGELIPAALSGPRTCGQALAEQGSPPAPTPYPPREPAGTDRSQACRGVPRADHLPPSRATQGRTASHLCPRQAPSTGPPSVARGGEGFSRSSTSCQPCSDPHRQNRHWSSQTELWEQKPLKHVPRAGCGRKLLAQPHFLSGDSESGDGLRAELAQCCALPCGATVEGKRALTSGSLPLWGCQTEGRNVGRVSRSSFLQGAPTACSGSGSKGPAWPPPSGLTDPRRDRNRANTPPVPHHNRDHKCHAEGAGL